MAWDYTQTEDPGAVGVGKTWLHPTTGVLKVRNTANTAWTTIGNVDDPNFGSLLTSGGAVSANITGNTGWAASDAHNFPTSASINGVAIATINDVTSRISALESSVVSLISSAIATYASSLTFNTKVAFTSGQVLPVTWDAVQTFPFGPGPFQYGDLSPVLASEAKWMVAPCGTIGWGTGSTSSDTYFRFRNPTDTADANPCVDQSWILYEEFGESKDNIPYAYFIFAMRP